MKKNAVVLVLILLLGLAGTGVANQKVAVFFSYEPADQVESVHLAGSFNGWSTTATPMKDRDGDGVYKTNLKLAPGNYGYRFVINGDQWVKPPQADAYGQYGYGDETGIIYVQGRADVKKKAERQDERIAITSLKHDKNDLSYANQLGKRKIRLKLRTKKDDVEQVYLYYDDGQDHQVELEHYLSTSNFDYYRTTIQVAQRNFGYQFKVQDGNRTIWYDGNGVVNLAGVEVDNLVPINYVLDQDKIFTTPNWVKDAVFYQIFPDRFYNGNFSNDPEKIEVYKTSNQRYSAANPDWTQGVPAGTPHVVQGKTKFSNNNNAVQPKYGYHVFYGGDLQGVEQKISYLKRLGINTIYFNPLFEAVSNHKYNTSNYKLVEDTLAVKGDHQASEKYLRQLIKKLHKNGIRVIFDAAFNYTGYEHWAFQDVVKNGKSSQYADWYFINDYPVVKLYNQNQNQPPNYKCWWGLGSYPVLNVNNPEVKKYLFTVTKKWMDPNGDGDPSDGIDGWRLDMPRQVKKTNQQFWREWRQFVKNINQEAYITGEIWDNANQYLQGTEFDGVMNYRFRKAVVDFIAQGKIRADKFADRLAALRFDYPQQSNYVLQNLIGSHDTKRFLTAAGKDKQRLKLASLLQMTYLGAPMIYYGDEVGLTGGPPPDSRRTMLWSDRGYIKPDQELFSHYQQLIKIRQQEPALRYGDLKQIAVDNKLVYGFKRTYQEQEVMVLINAAEKQVDLTVPVEVSDGQYRELYTEKTVEVADGKLQLTLEPLSGAIVKLRTESSGAAKLKVTAERNARLVVRGTMNNWGDWETGQDIVMNKNPDGSWSVVLSGLTPGKTYTYKYALEYKNSNTEIGSIGPDSGGNYSFTAQGRTHTLKTPFTKQELEEEKGWFAIKSGTIKVRGQTAKLGKTIEVGVPAKITVNNKYHKAKTITPKLDIGELNEVTVKLNQPQEPIEYTFTFDPDNFGNPDIIEGVWIKGSFDAWQEHKMTERGGIYQLTLELYPGQYKYVFFDKTYKDDQGAYKYYKDNGEEFTLELTTE